MCIIYLKQDMIQILNNMVLICRECSQEPKIEEMNNTCVGYELETVLCNSTPCSSNRWDISPWGECDSPCGGGTYKFLRLLLSSSFLWVKSSIFINMIKTSKNVYFLN